MDKLVNKPEGYVKAQARNNYTYVAPVSLWAPPPYRSIVLVDSLVNSLTMLWSNNIVWGFSNVCRWV